MGRRTPEDGRLDWELPAQTLHNLVRAVSDPWPGAFGYAGANKFIVWKSRVRHDLPAAKPGTVLSIAPLIVACPVSYTHLAGDRDGAPPRCPTAGR